MMSKSIVSGLVLLLVWTGLARAQGRLDAPVPSENAADCPDCRAKPYRPILNLLIRNRPATRTTSTALMQPTPQPERPTRDDLARMVNDGNFSPAEITAAKIKMDETQARARQAAVSYLATVDCHYYPEAEYSLIAALRADRSEAVRLEAALALGTCRGATVRILDALHLAATAQETDGNPAETSERVRMAARRSLNQLLASGMAGSPNPPPVPVQANPQPAVLPKLPNPPTQAVSQSVSQQEHDLAATVGVQPKIEAPTRLTLFGRWLDFIRRRDAGPAQPAVDPRLRGMTPLGSDSQLAIPSTRPAAGTP